MKPGYVESGYEFTGGNPRKKENWRPIKQPETPADFSTMEMIKNIPESGKQFIRDVFTPFFHPIQTAKSLGMLMPGTGVFPETPERREQRGQAWGQIGEMVKGRYGSPEALKQTLMTDPVGSLADISALATGGGALAAKAPGMIGKTGQALQKTGMAVEPLNIMKAGIKAPFMALPKGLPARMYESSAKFGTTIPMAKRTAMAETALKHQIMPTAAGLDKITDLMSGLDVKINELVSTATKQGKTIPKKALFRHLKETRRKLGGVKAEAPKDLRQIDTTIKMFDKHLKKIKKTHLTPEEVLEFKRDVYKRAGFDKDPFKPRIGAEEAKKAMGRAAKESLEEMTTPEMAELNRQLGEFVELKRPLEKSAGRIENRNIMGVDVPVKIGAGGIAGGEAGAAAGALLSILESPRPKAWLGIRLKELQNAGLLGLIDQDIIPTLSHYGLLQAGRLEPIEPEAQ